MGFKYIRKMPEPTEIKQEIPLSDELKKVKAKNDQEIRNIFEEKSNKFILIIGPCSADNEEAVLEYINKLAALQEKVKEKILMIPRIYTNKPRTTGLGYKGMNHQPDPQKQPDIIEGMKSVRRMHIKAIQETHLPTADEMLYPGNFPYLEDILSYVAVGARSVENQQHRLTASGFKVPAGMKNPTSGDNSIMINAIIAAQASHVFSYNGHEVETEGNELTHAILRGYTNNVNQSRPNYHYEDLIRTIEAYKEKTLKNPSLIIDTNHANSAKKYKDQIRIAEEIMYSRNNNKDIKQYVKGLMVESYLVEGSQKIGENIYGKSITDPCIGWEDTEKLVYTVAENI